MLSLDNPIELHGVSIFRDFDNPALFYYLPGSPRIATVDGAPLFQLLIYRGQALRGRAGGFLAMTVDLAVPAGVLLRVQGELSSRYGVSAGLAALPVTQGSVKITALEKSDDAETQGSGFVERLITTARPSLYGDQRAVFAATLDAEGAILLRRSFEQEGAIPVSVVYSFDYRGLLPAYDCRIMIKFRQSYEFLRTRAQVATLWFKSDVDREMETLRKKSVIEIKEIVYDTDDPAKRQERLQQLQTLAKELAQWSFFKPGLNPGEVLAKERGDLTVTDPSTAAATFTEGFSTPIAASFSGLGAREDVGTPRRSGAAAGSDQLGGEAAPEAGPATADTGTPADRPMTAVEAWNRAGRPQGAFMLREINQHETQDIDYHLKQVSAAQRSISPQGTLRLLPGMAGARGRILEVDLNDEFFKKIEGTVSTAVELAALGIDQIAVGLRYGVADDGRRPKDNVEPTLDDATREVPYAFFVDRLGTADVEWNATVSFRPGFAIGFEGSTVSSGWAVAPTRALLVDPQQIAETLRVDRQVGQVDWTAVSHVQVVVRYRDPVRGIDASRVELLRQDRATARVPVRPAPGGPDEVLAECTYHYTDGESDVVEVSRNGSGIIVLNTPPNRTRQVTFQLSDPSARYVRMSLEVELGGATKLVDLTTHGGRETLSYRRTSPADEAIRYRMVAVLKDGLIESPWTSTSSGLVLVGDRSVGTLRVEVSFLDTLAAGGFRALQLKLAYPDAPDWADGVLEQVVRDTTQPIVWEVPMSDRTKRTWICELSWLKTDGTRVKVGPVPLTVETLVLDPLLPEVLT